MTGGGCRFRRHDKRHRHSSVQWYPNLRRMRRVRGILRIWGSGRTRDRQHTGHAGICCAHRSLCILRICRMGGGVRGCEGGSAGRGVRMQDGQCICAGTRVRPLQREHIRLPEHRVQGIGFGVGRPLQGQGVWCVPGMMPTPRQVWQTDKRTILPSVSQYLHQPSMHRGHFSPGSINFCPWHVGQIPDPSQFSQRFWRL